MKSWELLEPKEAGWILASFAPNIHDWTSNICSPFFSQLTVEMMYVPWSYGNDLIHDYEQSDHGRHPVLSFAQSEGNMPNTTWSFSPFICLFVCFAIAITSWNIKQPLYFSSVGYCPRGTYNWKFCQKTFCHHYLYIPYAKICWIDHFLILRYLEINTTQKISGRYIQVWMEGLGQGDMVQLLREWVS